MIGGPAAQSEGAGTGRPGGLVFVVGNARSGTSILCDCLNVSQEIHLIHEAHLFLHASRPDFVGFFNEQHVKFGNQRSKGTYLPPGAAAGDGLAVLARLGATSRWVGEKIALGPQPFDAADRTHQAFFDFHATHFFDAWHFLILRRPTETVWSMSKMFPQFEIDELIRCWLDTVEVTLDVARTFPNARTLCWDRLDADGIAALARLLDVTLTVPDGLFRRELARSRLDDGPWPTRLAPFRRSLERCEALYVSLQEALSPSTYLFDGVDPRRVTDDLRARLRWLQQAVRVGRSSRKSTALASGERLVPGGASIAAVAEHLGRYAIAAPLVHGKRVVDLGCGAGYGSEWLARAGAASVLGVDQSPDAIAYAREHHGGTQVHFEVADLRTLTPTPTPCDVAVMFEVLEHLEEQHEVLRRVADTLRDDGVLVLSTPNQAEHPHETFNPYHTHELTRDELLALLAPHFAHVELYGFAMGFGTLLHHQARPLLDHVRVDRSVLDRHGSAESPFLVAVCGKRQPAPRLPDTFLPATYDRALNAAALLEQQHAQARRLAIELAKTYASDPAAFKARVRGLDPVGRLALSGLIRSCIDQDQHAVVLDLVRALYREERDHADWPFLFAVCLHRLGGTAWAGQARHLFGRALDLGYDEFWARLHRGSLALGIGDVDGALPDLARAHELNPDHPWARDAYGKARQATTVQEAAGA